MLPAINTDNDLAERTLLSLTREIAMDVREIEDILKSHGIDRNQFENISKTSRFQRLLTDQLRAWESAGNTEERVKIKMLSSVEESLPEMHARLHDTKEPLSAKVELLKTLMKGSGVGAVQGENTADKVSIVINMGATQVTAQAKLPGRVIDHEDVLDV